MIAENSLSLDALMRSDEMFSRRARFVVLPILTAVIALAIFFFHTLWNDRISLGTLYVIVILIAVNFTGRWGLIAVAACCMLLELVGHMITDGPFYSDTDISRMCVGLASVALTTVMASRMQANTEKILNQAKLLDLTQDAIFVRDMNDRVIYWNHGSEVLFGWSTGDVFRKKTTDLLATRFPIARESIFTSLFLNGRWEGELVHTDRAGNEHIVSSRWSLQRDNMGKPVSILQTDTDITASRRSRDRLTELQTALEHLTRISALGEMTTTIAHEVTQPLAGIIANGDACLHWLAQDDLQTDEIKAAVGRIVRDGRRAADVIHRMRSLSRKSEPTSTPLRLAEVIEDTMLLLREEMLDRGVSLKIEVPEDEASIVVESDKVQLQQVIINLAMNAMQSMASTAIEARELSVGVTRNATKAIISVSDAGTGIANIEKDLFTAFFTTKQQGIGMGLAICRSIVETNGGRIWATGNQTAGATFHFSLPIRNSAAE